MKYGTRLVFGIDPKELETMLYKEALIAMKNGAIKQKRHFVRDAPSLVHKWSKRRKAIIDYIDKSIAWCEDKIQGK